LALLFDLILGEDSFISNCLRGICKQERYLFVMVFSGPEPNLEK